MKEPLKNKALQLLAKREHTRKELAEKLKDSTQAIHNLDELLDEIAATGLQSDQRFIESHIRRRMQKGYGPQYITQELKTRGVSDEDIRANLNKDDSAWCEMAALVRIKRFGETPPDDRNARAKQVRFLQYRGFTTEQINHALKIHEQM